MKALVAQAVTFAGFVALPLAVVAPKAETFLLAGTALVALYALARSGEWRALVRQRFLWLLLSLVAFAAATAPAAVDAREALRLAGSLAGLFVAAAVVLCAARLDEGPRRNFAATAGAGYAFGCLLLAVEFWGGMPITHLAHYGGGAGPSPEPVVLNPALSVLAIVVWPYAAAGQRLLGILALGAATILILKGDMMSARIALAAGGVAFVLTQWFGRFLTLTAGVLAVLFIAAVPLLPGLVPVARMQPALAELRSSVEHRLEIWQFAAERISERPVLGWGLDSSRAIPGGDQTVFKQAEALPLHPHDAALQVWLELGLWGAFVLAAVTAMAFRAAADFAPGMPRAAATAVVVSALTLAFLSYGIWQNWWLAVLALGAMTTRAALPVAAPTAPRLPAKKPGAGAGQALAKIPTARIPAALAKK